MHFIAPESAVKCQKDSTSFSDVVILHRLSKDGAFFYAPNQSINPLRLPDGTIKKIMALIKPSTPFDAIKRKFAKSDEIHFRNRKADNATISVRVKHPYNGGNSCTIVTKTVESYDATKKVGY